MEDKDLQDIWKTYDQKLEESWILNMQSWALNLQSFTMVQSLKARTRLQSLSSYKIRVLVFGLVWVLFVGMLVAHSPFYVNPYFNMSAILVLLVNISSMGGYLYHVYLINQISYEGNITDTQQKLARLRSSTLQVIRIAWLQMPFYTTFFWHPSWVDFTDWHFLLIALPVTLFFTWLAIYLFLNTTAGNLHKKWIRLLVAKSPEYTALLKAHDFIDEIDQFRKNL